MLLYCFIFLSGTPPRITSDMIDYSKCIIQPGDAEPTPFSFMNERVKINVGTHCIKSIK